MKKIILCLIIALFMFTTPIFAESLDNISGEDSIEIVTTGANVPAYKTNTNPTIDNVVVQTEEVESLISQWKAVVLMVKSGGFSFGLLLLTIIPLLLVSFMTLGVVIVTLLRFITLLTPEHIDEKIDKIEDWITDYMVKIPITILSNLRKFKKKE